MCVTSCIDESEVSFDERKIQLNKCHNAQSRNMKQRYKAYQLKSSKFIATEQLTTRRFNESHTINEIHPWSDGVDVQAQLALGSLGNLFVGTRAFSDVCYNIYVVLPRFIIRDFASLFMIGKRFLW